MTERYLTKSELLEELQKHEAREEATMRGIFDRLSKLETKRSASDQIVNFLRDEMERLRTEIEKLSKKLEKTFIDGIRSRIAVSLLSTVGTAVLTAVSVNFFLQK